MTRVKDILEYIDSFAPFSGAAEFDNSGLLLGNGEAEVKGVLVCLDANKKAIEKAKKTGANLIVSHHPIIFDSLKSIEYDGVVAQCVRADISVISAHTNIDLCPIGTSALMCKTLSLENQSVLDGEGFLRMGELKEPLSEKELLEKVKALFNTTLRANSVLRKIKKVAVCAGSGGSFVFDAVSAGADALITGDVKHDQFISACNNDFLLIDAGHEATESIYIPFFREKLSEKFPELKIESFSEKIINFI